MKPKLSILCASIRAHLLPNVYNSIKESFHDTFEFIVVSPYNLPKELENNTDIKLIKDWGSPSRGWQIALLNAEGEYVHYTADDVTYFPNTLDNSLKLLQGQPDNVLVMGKYSEGQKYNQYMMGEDYYHFSFHKQIEAYTKGVDCLILNVGTCKTQLLKDFGGWDCQYESASICLLDFSIRLQTGGVKVIVQPEPIFYCTWSGDPSNPDNLKEHAPVDSAHNEHDLPLLTKLYLGENAPPIASKIDINNWTKAQSVWRRRFSEPTN